MDRKFTLEPCPFCGNIPKIEIRKVEQNVDCRPDNYISVGVWCNKCWFGLCNAVHDEKNVDNVLQEKVQRWNTRVNVG